MNALKQLYPDLTARECPGVTGFFVAGEKESVADVIFPHRADLEKTIETAIWITDQGVRYRIPTLEASLANKYGAMLCLARDPIKRTFDAADFATMVKHALDIGRTPVDMELIAEFGELVWQGGGKELVQLVEDAKLGKVPNLNR